MELNTATVDNAADKAHSTVNKMAENANRQSTETIERLAASAHKTVDRLAESAGPAFDWINESTGHLKERQQAMVEQCRGYVQERPLTTLLAALAAGYVIGRLTSTR